MKKYSLSALAAAGLLAGGLSVSSATAADLGGNCCADLEERIAELEATTARKGNRKVSLTVSGWVAEQVTWWDNGTESNTYVGGIGTTLGTNIKFSGQATIAPGWTAGYLIHLEADGSDTLAGTNANTPAGAGLFAGTTNFVQTMQSYWFLKSEQLGKVSVGLLSMASDNTAILVDGSGSLVTANWVAFNVGGFAFQNTGGGGNQGILSAGSCIPGDCFGVPANAVRYDSPTFAGFSVSAGWGADDVWDVAARWAGEAAGFKVAAAAAYGESTDATLFGNANDSFQAGVYVQHIPSGLFVLGNYGWQDDGGQTAAAALRDEGETWYVKAGLRQRWNHLGHTVLYGEYLDSETDSIGGAIVDQEFNWWGAGIVQEIDNAAMSMWLRYRTYEFDDNIAANTYDDFDEVTFGALINF
jgi:Gram-negative porin